MSTLLDSDITNAIGMTVDIKLTRSPNTLTGNIYTIIKDANLLVLLSNSPNTPNSPNNPNLFTYIINIPQIKSISISKTQIEIDSKDLMKIDLSKVLDTENRNLSKDILIKKAETEPNFQKGLSIYEALSKLYKCTYDGKRIVLDEIDSFIEAPFHLSNLHCDDNENKQRLSRIISNAIKSRK